MPTSFWNDVHVLCWLSRRQLNEENLDCLPLAAWSSVNLSSYHPCFAACKDHQKSSYVGYVVISLSKIVICKSPGCPLHPEQSYHNCLLRVACGNLALLQAEFGNDCVLGGLKKTVKWGECWLPPFTHLTTLACKDHQASWTGNLQMIASFFLLIPSSLSISLEGQGPSAPYVIYLWQEQHTKWTSLGVVEQVWTCGLLLCSNI